MSSQQQKCFTQHFFKINNTNKVNISNYHNQLPNPFFLITTKSYSWPQRKLSSFSTKKKPQTNNSQETSHNIQKKTITSIKFDNNLNIIHEITTARIMINQILFFNQIFLNLTCAPNKHDKQNDLSLKDKSWHHIIKIQSHKILQIPKVIKLFKCKMKFFYHIFCNNIRLQRPKLQTFRKY